MRPQRRATTYLRAAMVGLALLLPALSLIPLGSLWLWQRGYLLYWVVAALALSISSYLFELWLVHRRTTAPPGDADPSHSATPPDQAFSPRESQAWAAVEALAEN